MRAPASGREAAPPRDKTAGGAIKWPEARAATRAREPAQKQGGAHARHHHRRGGRRFRRRPGNSGHNARARLDLLLPEAQEEIKAGLAGHARVTLHVYEGQDHAFARVGGGSYDKAAADLANGRSIELLKGSLS